MNGWIDSEKNDSGAMVTNQSITVYPIIIIMQYNEIIKYAL